MKTRPPAARTSSAAPPTALLSHTDALWRDHRRVAQWWERYIDQTAPSETGTLNAPTWATRFDRAAVAWAVQAGTVTAEGTVDWDQLQQVGVMRPVSVERAAARAGSDYCCHSREGSR